MSNNASSVGPGNGERSQDGTLRREEPPFFSKLWFAGYMYGLKGVLAPLLWLRDWQEYYNPPESRPNIIKTYECRPLLPVRIFFPSSYDQTSPTTLPTLFTIHGGGFCLGHARDDDDWNRAFADTHAVLVIALNYSKAPTHPFPTAPHDIEALLLAVLADDSLPIDRSSSSSSPSPRTAILGFSAGGNLALSAVQLPRIKSHPLRPRAAVSVYGALDLSITPPSRKLQNRAPQKKALPPPRGNKEDPLVGLAPAFDWSYIPYGHDLRDPLLSPHFVRGQDLPPWVCLVGAELDMLAHESWRVACRLAGEMRPEQQSGVGEGRGAKRRVVPDRESEEVRWRVCGNTEGKVVVGKGRLIGVKGQKQQQQQQGQGDEQGDGGGEQVVVEDERYAFEDNWEGGGVKWLLVPDVLHGFDNPGMRGLVGGKEAMEDAVLKTEAYTAELARWLKEVVWKV